MATGSGWQQQYYCPAGQGKFTSPSASNVPFQSGIAMEYTQDLHLKMSKKIAQLTKGHNKAVEEEEEEEDADGTQAICSH